MKFGSVSFLFSKNLDTTAVEKLLDILEHYLATVQHGHESKFIFTAGYFFKLVWFGYTN